MKSIISLSAIVLMLCSFTLTANACNSCSGQSDDGYYYDLQGNQYSQSYLPISHDHNIKYSCIESDDPASCS